MRLNSNNDYGKDGNMSNSIYYKATDEDGNTVLKHALEKNKYLYTKNGKHVYPEDVNKEVKIVKKVAKRDTSEKAAATKYFPDKAYKSPTANAARVKANSVKSNAEYKLTRAGEKLTNDVKSSGAYKLAKKEINRIPKNVNKAYESAKSSIPTAAEVRNKANSVKSKAEYKLTRTGEKLTNDVKSSGAYKSANKGINSISKNANKAYKSAKKKAKKVNRTFNIVKRAGKAYLDYLTK